MPAYLTTKRGGAIKSCFGQRTAIESNAFLNLEKTKGEMCFSEETYHLVPKKKKKAPHLVKDRRISFLSGLALLKSVTPHVSISFVTVPTNTKRKEGQNRRSRLSLHNRRSSASPFRHLSRSKGGKKERVVKVAANPRRKSSSLKVLAEPRGRSDFDMNQTRGKKKTLGLSIPSLSGGHCLFCPLSGISSYAHVPT